MDSKSYDKLVQKHTIKEDTAKDVLVSFLFGGLMGLLGHFFVETFLQMGLKETDAITLMLMLFIFTASILTGLGVFDRLMGKFKAGLLIPITGFAHSVTSACLEYKKEGLIQGIGSNTFKLAGSVLVYGIVTAYFIGLIMYLMGVL